MSRRHLRLHCSLAIAPLAVVLGLGSCSGADDDCSGQLGDGGPAAGDDPESSQQLCRGGEGRSPVTGPTECSCNDRSCLESATCRAADFTCPCGFICSYPAFGSGSEQYFEEFGCLEACDEDRDCLGENQICVSLSPSEPVSVCVDPGEARASSFVLRLLPEGRSPLPGDFSTAPVQVEFDGESYLFEAGSAHVYADPFMGEMIVLMFVKFGWPDLFYFQIYLPADLYAPGTYAMFLHDDEDNVIGQNFGASLYRAGDDLWQEVTPTSGNLELLTTPEPCFGPDCEMLTGSLAVEFVGIRGKLIPEETAR